MPRGRPSLAQQYIERKAGIRKSSIQKMVKAEVKKDVKKEVKAGRPKASIQSAQIIGGKIRLRLSKSRSIRIGKKVVDV